jgi:hypothetical protein
MTQLGPYTMSTRGRNCWNGQSGGEIRLHGSTCPVMPSHVGTKATKDPTTRWRPAEGYSCLVNFPQPPDPQWRTLMHRYYTIHSQSGSWRSWQYWNRPQQLQPQLKTTFLRPDVMAQGSPQQEKHDTGGEGENKRSCTPPPLSKQR